MGKALLPQLEIYKRGYVLISSYPGWSTVGKYVGMRWDLLIVAATF